MDLPDLKKLDKLIALCRKRGVKSVQIDNMTIELGDAPEAKTKSKRQQQSQLTEFMHPDEDGLTEEQLLAWSVTNLPGDSQPPSE